jgi:hypothetical protein
LNHHEQPPSLPDTCATYPNKILNKPQANINLKRGHSSTPIKETTAPINNTNKIKQKTKQNKTKQNKTKQNKTKQNKTKQNNITSHMT